MLRQRTAPSESRRALYIRLRPESELRRTVKPVPCSRAALSSERVLTSVSDISRVLYPIVPSGRKYSTSASNEVYLFMLASAS